MGLFWIQETWREWNLPGEMIGCTSGKWGDAETFDSRGQEIELWLEKKAIEPYRFVVIDGYSIDESARCHEDYWITVNPHCGISKKDADRAIQLLNQH